MRTFLLPLSTILLLAACRSEDRTPAPPPSSVPEAVDTTTSTDSVETDPVVREFRRWSRSLQASLVASLSEVRAIPLGRERDSALLVLIQTWHTNESADSMVAWANRNPAVLGALYLADQDSSRRQRIEMWLARAGLIDDGFLGEFEVRPYVGARMDLLKDLLTPTTLAYLKFGAGAGRIPPTDREGIEVPWDSLSSRILTLESIHRTQRGTVAADKARQDALLLAGYLIGHDEFDPVHDQFEPCFDENGEVHPGRLRAWRRLAAQPFDSPIHEIMAEWVSALDAAGLRNNPDLGSLHSGLLARLRALRPSDDEQE